MTFSPYKQQFPFFKNNPQITYFDNAATTQKPYCFFDYLQYGYENLSFPAFKSIYNQAENTFNIYTDYCNFLINTINGDKNTITFIYPSATLIAYFIFEKLFLYKNFFSVIALPTDGHNNTIGYFTSYNNNYTIIWYDTENPSEEIFQKADVIYINALSHITGHLFDFNKYFPYKKKDQIWIVDACQYSPIFTIDIKKMNADIIFFSFHKMYGPYNVAHLIINKESKLSITSLCIGNNKEQKLTCGSLPIADYYASYQMYKWVIKNIYGDSSLIDRYKNYHKYITNILLKNNFIITSSNSSISLISGYHKKYHAHDCALLLSEKNILCRSGDLCANKWFTNKNHSSYVRFSIGYYNDEEDLNRLSDIKF